MDSDFPSFEPVTPSLTDEGNMQGPTPDGGSSWVTDTKDSGGISEDGDGFSRDADVDSDDEGSAGYGGLWIRSPEDDREPPAADSIPRGTGSKRRVPVPSPTVTEMPTAGADDRNHPGVPSP